ncbi:MAG: Rne/Rng family ribonuclease [Nitrospinales bacterium]
MKQTKVEKTKKMLINADHPEECRVVIVENGKLEELIVEHATRENIKGNVYKGVITRVEPAFEAAFVDIGRKKFGFLPFKDVRRESYLKTRERKAKMRIQDVLVKGQKIMVQVVKEERDAKGPTLTNYVTVPGRFLVLMCGSASGGVSRKIEDESERKKMKEILKAFELSENMGVIIRTAGMGRTKSELQKDLQMLLKIWHTIEKENQGKTAPPCLLYQVPDMVERTVRDHFTADTSEIIVDNAKSYKALKEFFKLVMPRMRNRVKLYSETKPLFSQYNIEEQIESIYNRRVDLPSGGSIIFDVGEAMVAIDVNSGKTTGASELEDTAVKTNLEAADEIARQLHLRDLGGLIVIDFIDMNQKKNKSLLEKQIKLACKKDKARINISKISKFGLLEMSRQRLSPPVGEGAFDRCEMCDGAGRVKSKSSVTLEVLRRIQGLLAAKNVKTLSVEVSTDIVTYLLNHKMRFILDLEESHDVNILFNAKPSLRYENFSFTILEKKKDVDTRPQPPREYGAGKSEEEVSRREPASRSFKRDTGKRDTREKTKRPKTTSRRKYTRKTTGRRPASSRVRKDRPAAAESVPTTAESVPTPAPEPFVPSEPKTPDPALLQGSVESASSPDEKRGQASS